MIRCEECGKELHQISFKHLKACSGITPKEYKEKHPEAPLMDEESKNKCSLKDESNPRWKGGISRQSRFCLECGKTISKGGKSGLCKSCSQKGEGNPFYGKTHTQETRDKLIEAHKHRTDYTHVSMSEESKKKLSESHKKNWSNLSIEERTEKVKHWVQAGMLASTKSKDTRIELAIKAILIEQQIEYRQCKRVHGFFVDFLLYDKNIIIECYGDYWHCNPLFYDADYFHKGLGSTAEQKWKKDQLRKEKLEQAGYKVIVFWEHDIKTNMENICTVIKSLL